MNSALGLMCAVLLFAGVGYGGVVYQLQRTLFSDAFALAEIERVDPVRTATSTLLEHLPANPGPLLTTAVEQALEQQRPWLVAELRRIAIAVQEFLRGNAGGVVVTIDPAPLRQALLGRVQTLVDTGAVPELQQLPEAERLEVAATARRAADEAVEQLAAFRFDTDALSPDVNRALLQLRDRLGLFRVPLFIVVVIVLAVGGIAALVGETRKAGAGIMAAGVVLLLPPLLAPQVMEQLPVGRLNLPGVIVVYLPTLAEHMMAPLLPIAFGAMVIGLVLVGLSFMVFARRRRRPHAVRHRR